MVSAELTTFPGAGVGTFTERFAVLVIVGEKRDS